MVNFPENKCSEGVRFNVSSVARGGGGVAFNSSQRLIILF